MGPAASPNGVIWPFCAMCRATVRGPGAWTVLEQTPASRIAASALAVLPAPGLTAADERKGKSSGFAILVAP